MYNSYLSIHNGIYVLFKKESMEASNGLLEGWLMILYLKINTKPGTQEYIWRTYYALLWREGVIISKYILSSDTCVGRE